MRFPSALSTRTQSGASKTTVIVVKKYVKNEMNFMHIDLQVASNMFRMNFHRTKYYDGILSMTTIHTYEKSVRHVVDFSLSAELIWLLFQEGKEKCTTAVLNHQRYKRTQNHC